MAIEESVVETSLGRLFCRRAGVGEPSVLCLHGFYQSSRYWAPTIARLEAAHAQAIAVDLPGFGDSADATGPYTMEGYADRLAVLLDALAVSQVVLIGGSMGGVVAQHFALRHPQRLSRLVLVATGARTPDPVGALAKADIMAQHPLSDEDIRHTVEGFFHRAPPEIERGRYEEIVRAASRMAAVEVARSNARSDTRERLRDIHTPTLIVQGRHDRGRTPDHGAWMCAQMPQATLVVMEDSGHTPQLEEPEVFHQAIIPFVMRGVSPAL